MRSLSRIFGPEDLIEYLIPKRKGSSQEYYYQSLIFLQDLPRSSKIPCSFLQQCQDFAQRSKDLNLQDSYL